MAILFPFLVLLIFAVVQVGAYFLARTVALTGAQAAVSSERQFDAELGQGKQHAEALLAQAGSWLLDAQVSDPTYTADGVTYTVSGTAVAIIPGLSWPVEQSAHGTLERFTVP